MDIVKLHAIGARLSRRAWIGVGAYAACWVVLVLALAFGGKASVDIALVACVGLGAALMYVATRFEVHRLEGKAWILECQVAALKGRSGDGEGT